MSGKRAKPYEAAWWAADWGRTEDASEMFGDEASAMSWLRSRDGLDQWLLLKHSGDGWRVVGSGTKADLQP